MPPPIQASQGGFDQHVVVLIRNRDTVTSVKLFLPLQFVCGDAKSQDTLCGRYGRHSTKRATGSLLE